MIHPSVRFDKAFMGAENATLRLIPSASVLWWSQQQVFLKVKRANRFSRRSTRCDKGFHGCIRSGSSASFAIKFRRRSPVCFLVASWSVDLTVGLKIISSIPITEVSTADVTKSVSYPSRITGVIFNSKSPMPLFKAAHTLNCVGCWLTGT
jgi:hypothetical protein